MGFNKWLIEKFGWDQNVRWYTLASQLSDQDPQRATISVLELFEAFEAEKLS